MEKRKRGGLAGGMLLILFGGFFLLWQLRPELLESVLGSWFDWPVIIIGAGFLFLLAAVLGQVGGLAIPGCIISGIGFILAWQNATGNWGSWAYIWALIPGLVGLGLVIGSVLGKNNPGSRRVGAIMFVISLAVTSFFASMFTYHLAYDFVWPVVLIILGIFLLAKALFKKE
ncbi:MAG: hypothetical protein K8R77_09330 [Anaerolineaceae bacterium]|nr:hypothetical protein [Anaerolineaceae bacterium]